MTKRSNIIGYDGDCALCHGFVLFVLKRDRKDVFVFSPLHSEYFTAQLSSLNEPIPDSVILVEGERILFKSSAVVRVLHQLGFGWKFVGHLLWIVPRPLRNLGYDLVAKVRKKVFKQPTVVCPVVPSKWKNRFKT